MTHDQPRPDWTVVLRRRPARIVAGRADGGYTEQYEIVCCYCGDDPGLGLPGGLAGTPADPRPVSARGGCYGRLAHLKGGKKC
jgi:hypothetical protein